MVLHEDSPIVDKSGLGALAIQVIQEEFQNCVQVRGVSLTIYM